MSLCATRRWIAWAISRSWAANSGRELFNSTVHWIKTPNTNNFYPAGFTNNDLPVFASGFLVPNGVKTNRCLDITNGLVAFFNGNLDYPPLAGTFTNTFFMKTNSSLLINPPNVNTQTISIVTTTGKIKAKVYTPIDPGNRVRVPLGAVLQDEKLGYGVFKGTNASGALLLHGTP